ncbi:hypothetical protein [Arsenophonus nasoniae]|uniref:Uncharacterized protein n=1 Tax=Arsenophonus nasoniae TaxID=638 RepID=A0AA95GGN6_9GAMM|nr:hypothetical protein [Arsenophonus nasoniae]WGL96538.1 hypothetical protein QE207_08375 [Arsenophonus nasoniae]
MKTIILDVTALSGIAAVLAGCYLKYGLANTLITGGSLLVVYALLASRRRNHVT